MVVRSGFNKMVPQSSRQPAHVIDLGQAGGIKVCSFALKQ
jgi:hypothetical protein